jgi:cyclophilin family peptidyl-prolyl cis-trans isomerase
LLELDRQPNDTLVAEADPADKAATSNARNKGRFMVILPSLRRQWSGFPPAFVSSLHQRAGLALALALVACGDSGAPPEPGPPVPVPEAAAPRDVAVIEVADLGEIRLELLADVAPATAAHFASLAEQGYYDGVTFHRVVPGFMIQGGDPNTRDRDPRNDGQGGQDRKVQDERPAVSHVRGIVSLANRGLPNSGATQFFIVLADARHLDGQFAVFGRVVAGMDVVDRIATVERDVYARHGPAERPLRDVVMKRVRIERAKPGAVP